MDTATATTGIEALVDLRRQLQELAGLDRVPTMGLGEAVQALEILGQIVNTAQTSMAGLAARVEREGGREIGQQYGCKDSNELVRRMTGSSYRAVRERQQLGEKILPQASEPGAEPPLARLAAAMGQGTVSEASGKIIANTLDHLAGATPIQRAQVEADLVARASGQDGDGSAHPALAASLGELRAQAGSWERELGARRREAEKRTFESRSFDLAPQPNGMVRVSGLLTPEVAAAYLALADAINSPRQRSGPAETTPTQQRHDALPAIFHTAARAANGEIPTHGGAPITVMVQTSLEALSKGRGGQVLGLETTSVSQDTVLHGACSGAVVFLALNEKRRVVALSSESRTFTGVQRKAIAFRDRGCVIPGCDVRAAWCEVHHVQDWAHGGKTHTDNGVMLCWHHHRTLGPSGWQVKMSQGVPMVKAPPSLDPSRQWHPVSRQ
ncbi:DUF222 domain-containing protein [Actinomyces sp. F1_1611]